MIAARRPAYQPRRAGRFSDREEQAAFFRRRDFCAHDFQRPGLNGADDEIHAAQRIVQSRDALIAPVRNDVGLSLKPVAALFVQSCRFLINIVYRHDAGKFRREREIKHEFARSIATAATDVCDFQFNRVVRRYHFLYPSLIPRYSINGSLIIFAASAIWHDSSSVDDQ